MAMRAEEVYAILSKKIRSIQTPPEIDLSAYYTSQQIDSMFEQLIGKVPMSSTDTVVNLQPGKLYVFPEMATLTIQFMQVRIDTYQEYHFIFQSGATATVLTLPEEVKSDMVVEPNRIYEVSIVDNLLAWTSWAVSA